MEYLIHLAILFGIYGILSLSLNLVVGYTGLLSVAQAAFYGIGAYATAILITSFGFNFFIALLASVVLVMIVSLLVGWVLSRFSGDYYALGSIGFNVIMFGVFLNWDSMTRGPLGIPGIAKPNLFGIEFSDNGAFLILTMAVLILIYFLSKFIVNSSFGRVLKAIREDERTIRVFGYDTLYYKLLIFMIGAAIAGVAGSLFASYISYIDPSTFTIVESILILSMIILGGLANLKGSIIGALLLVLLPEFLRFVGFPVDIAAQTRQMVYGMLLVILMLYRPQGLVGEYKL
jgi:branched-chain amino acid transport system permease protein